VLANLEERARQLGLSRVEFLRRLLIRESSVQVTQSAINDWHHFAKRHEDLNDPDIMRAAW